MRIEPDRKHIPALTELWHKVFGDETDYISLFFDSVYRNSKVFIKEDNFKTVSALYLLPCRLCYNGESFNGFYLYAAATDPSYRKHGFMSSLINEAHMYARDEGADFIALVPASESLYDYYERFSYKRCMYKSYDVIDALNEGVSAGLCDVKTYAEQRQMCFDNHLKWGFGELSYGLSCFDFLGISTYTCDGFSFILNKGSNEISELCCSKDDYGYVKNRLVNMLDNGQYKVFSPYGKNKISFGMVYPINNKLTQVYENSVYMNIAFD